MGRRRLYFAVIAAATTLGACRLFVDLNGLGDGPDVADGAPDNAVDQVTGDGSITSDARKDVDPVSDGASDAPLDTGDGSTQPITFVSASKFLQTSTMTSIDLARPAGVVVGDVILVGLFTDVAATSVTTPTNFTKLSDTPIFAGDTHGWFYIHTVGNAEPATTAFTFTASPFSSIVGLAYRNVRAASPIDAQAFGTSAGTAYIAPSVTTTVPQTMLVAIYLADDTVGANWTAPSGMTSRADTGICAAFDRLFPGPGATGPVIALSDQNAAAENALIALAPK